MFKGMAYENNCNMYEQYWDNLLIWISQASISYNFKNVKCFFHLIVTVMIKKNLLTFTHKYCHPII